MVALSVSFDVVYRLSSYVGSKYMSTPLSMALNDKTFNGLLIIYGEIN